MRTHCMIGASVGALPWSSCYASQVTRKRSIAGRQVSCVAESSSSGAQFTTPHHSQSVPPAKTASSISWQVLKELMNHRRRIWPLHSLLVSSTGRRHRTSSCTPATWIQRVQQQRDAVAGCQCALCCCAVLLLDQRCGRWLVGGDDRLERCLWSAQ